MYVYIKILKPFSCWKILNPYLDKCNYKSEPYDRVYLIHVLYIVLLAWFWFSKQRLWFWYMGRGGTCSAQSPFQQICKVDILFENKHCQSQRFVWTMTPRTLIHVIVALHTYANWTEKTHPGMLLKGR